MPIRRLEDTLTATTATVAGEDIAASVIPVKPHIQPGILCPAIAGKLLDGTTSHSGAYGTAQSDGKSYYYTDIKGSGPIKDPRIGAHFGSQRHTFKSLQKLEQETASHGQNVYSVDGREWCRVTDTSNNLQIFYGDGGSCINQPNAGMTTTIEITGYFNDFNCISRTRNIAVDDINVTVNGGTTRNSADTDKLGGRTTQNSPLRNRFVDMGSVINHGDSNVTSDLGTTPSINTIKIAPINTGSEYWQFFGIELIAQDTSSTANRSKIQIPSQNVVSYGKKFTVSGTPHYDPFNGFTNGTTLHSAQVDTATSLGLGTATTWGAPWAISSSNHIRPLNGGRVVKWVDSSGTIKTSVTMMPRNAQNITTTASNEITTASATNSHTINFSDDAVEHSLSEVAKTFHWREFGNGSANGGTGATYADWSMYAGAADSIAYVMDDGLTSINGQVGLHNSGYGISVDTTSKYFYITFIGTGISWNTGGAASNPHATWAQNLPYGTHVLKFKTDGTNVWDGNVYLDGVDIKNDFASGSNREIYKWGPVNDISFYQPKMPPVPEDACILADYMLMADHVIQSDAEDTEISKGVRYVNGSRDHFCDSSASFVTNQSVFSVYDGNFGGFRAFDSPSGATATAKLPFFGTNAQAHIQGQHTSGWALTLGGSGLTEVLLDSGAGSFGDIVATNSGDAKPLGLIDLTTTVPAGGSGFHGTAVATPIHTSSHYQPFETPYLYELVGGDRNMEQTNLVVTPDGKTWDEVTRDTSYIGNASVGATGGPDNNNSTSAIVMTEWRGNDPPNSATKYLFNKDWAIAYDRMICLRDGYYMIHYNLKGIGGYETYYYRNASNMGGISAVDSVTHPPVLYFDRGDVFRLEGAWDSQDFYVYFQITRL